MKLNRFKNKVYRFSSFFFNCQVENKEFFDRSGFFFTFDLNLVTIKLIMILIFKFIEKNTSILTNNEKIFSEFSSLRRLKFFNVFKNVNKSLTISLIKRSSFMIFIILKYFKNFDLNRIPNFCIIDDLKLIRNSKFFFSHNYLSYFHCSTVAEYKLLLFTILPYVVSKYQQRYFKKSRRIK